MKALILLKSLTVLVFYISFCEWQTLFAQCVQQPVNATRYSIGKCNGLVHQYSIGSLTAIKGSCNGLSFDPIITGTDSPNSTRSIPDDLEAKIFPNPSLGELNIQLSHVRAFQLSIYDLLGKVVYSEVLGQTAEHRLDLSHFKAGCYLIKIENENKRGLTAKFIKI